MVSMKEQEYNRMRKYEQLRDDIRVLNDAAIIVGNPKLSPYPDSQKHSIVMRALEICSDEIPTLFRSVALSLKNELEEL